MAAFIETETVPKNLSITRGEKIVFGQQTIHSGAIMSNKNIITELIILPDKNQTGSEKNERYEISFYKLQIYKDQQIILSLKIYLNNTKIAISFLVHIL